MPKESQVGIDGLSRMCHETMPTRHSPRQKSIRSSRRPPELGWEEIDATSRADDISNFSRQLWSWGGWGLAALDPSHPSSRIWNLPITGEPRGPSPRRSSAGINPAARSCTRKQKNRILTRARFYPPGGWAPRASVRRSGRPTACFRQAASPPIQPPQPGLHRRGYRLAAFVERHRPVDHLVLFCVARRVILGHNVDVRVA